MLYSLNDAAKVLGGISPWTLRKHVSQCSVRVTRIGRRVFVDGVELERIQREGLPSLGFKPNGGARNPNGDSNDGRARPCTNE
jgi:hypothetical protein